MDQCMICYIEREIFGRIDDCKIIEHFQSMRTRRRQIPNAIGSGSGMFSTLQAFFYFVVFIH